MLKNVLSIMILSVSVGCGTIFPKPPPHTQYGVHADLARPGFYGVHSETKAKVYRPFNDPRMKGAQCIDPKDYRSGQNYLQQVREIAEARCH